MVIIISSLVLAITIFSIVPHMFLYEGTVGLAVGVAFVISCVTLALILAIPEILFSTG